MRAEGRHHGLGILAVNLPQHRQASKIVSRRISLLLCEWGTTSPENYAEGTVSYIVYRYGYSMRHS